MVSSLSIEVDPEPNDLLKGMNMDAKRLVIYHGGSWVGNCYEGGLTKWVHVPRGLTYDALVKLVQDVAKVDVARYTIELCLLVFMNSGAAGPRIENDNEVSCMMDEDKLLPEVYVTISQKLPTDCVQNGTIVEQDDNLLQSKFLQQCNQPTPQSGYGSQVSDTDNPDDVSIPDVDTDNADQSVGASSASTGPSGFATFSEGSEKYSLEPNRMDKAISNDGCLYKGKLFQCKKDLKRTLHMYALNEQFELRIKRSSKTCYEAGCKDGECEFQLRAFKMQKIRILGGSNVREGSYLQDRWFTRTSSTSKILDCRLTISTEVASTRPLSKTQRHHGRNTSGTWTTDIVHQGLEGKGSCGGICFRCSQRIIQTIACLLSPIEGSKSKDCYCNEDKCCKSV
ncbi:hypothetical protein EZV62_001189 [Acer yangbiense]|uniref:Transposase MuDR plant domain-containing protein n=1 Tax=Acer yangbiense TaxID=1000413 RepID=A0A5C7ITD8_9ROSI|nr:hypothetical protein EZV62_001189 [Acer yangbiense]